MIGWSFKGYGEAGREGGGGRGRGQKERVCVCGRDHVGSYMCTYLRVHSMCVYVLFKLGSRRYSSLSLSVALSVARARARSLSLSLFMETIYTGMCLCAAKISNWDLPATFGDICSFLLKGERGGGREERE